MSIEGLIHKQKSVSDLIRFIGNTTENNRNQDALRTPNYSILLGSGASITSGIRSGQILIREWKKEVYDELCEDKSIGVEDFFRLKNAPEWYEEANAYSSLFENRFDLQRHRRIFVENEVSGKTPSIGYAYLVKLIESGFFNTVFTTNFDDLLNEAFYRFSKNRPIICAHDSSISGITVTSTRPKIIKLHGDYLFENIKTTMRETESLELNMKLKFQEFAKDFGLIVVGYSGYDRSIMDILSFLLQHEDYFKNGIYWCIKKGDSEISPELRKLLWKDRVFFVEVDGFDELFAEINHKLNNGALPVDDAFLSKAHQESIIKDLTENPYLSITDSNNFLAQDCKRLREHYEDNRAHEFIEYTKEKVLLQNSKHAERNKTTKKINLKKLSNEQKRELDNLLDDVYLYGKREPVLKRLSQIDVFSLEDSRYKLELIELEADLRKDLTDYDYARYADELIRLNPDNKRYYEIAYYRTKDYDRSLSYLVSACERFKNDYFIINEYVSELLGFCEDNRLSPEFQEKLDELSRYIDKSLTLNANISNRAYQFKARYINLKYLDDIKKREEEIDSLCEKVMSLSKHHPNTLISLRIIHSKNLCEKLIKEALQFYKEADNDEAVEKIYIELIRWYDSKGNIEDVFDIFSSFEAEYNASNDYKEFKAKFLKNNEYFEEALKIYESLPDSYEHDKEKMLILSYLSLDDKMNDIYENSNFHEQLKETYLSITKNYEELIRIKSEENSPNKFTSSLDINNQAYNLLQLEKYQEVQTLLKPFYDNNDADGSTIVNYLYAEIMIDSKKKTKVKEKLDKKIIKNQYVDYSDIEKLGAYCVMEDSNGVIKHLRTVLKKNPVDKYLIKEWPIMSPFLSNQKVSDLLKPTFKIFKKRT